MRFLFILLVVIHAMIHFLGFTNAFGLVHVSTMPQQIPRNEGLLWLLVAVLFLLTAVLYYRDNYREWVVLPAIAISQILIVMYWQHAGYGTVVNLILLLAAIEMIAAKGFERSWQKMVDTRLREVAGKPKPILTREMAAHLPSPVQRYIRFSGAMNQPVVHSFTARFRGRIRKDARSEWMNFTCEQHNFVDNPSRLFFMKAKMKGLPVAGLHAYYDQHATMDIRLLSLFPVQYQHGKEMDVSETVTWFNDLCMLAPGALVDPRIIWEPVDDHSALAHFSNGPIRISATLYFDDSGALVNFVSDDRYYYAGKGDMRLAPWYTPLRDYTVIDGRKLAGFGKACVRLAHDSFCYGEFRLQHIRYNPEK